MFMVNSLIGFGVAADGGYTTRAVTFDGSNDYLTRGADLTGNADTKEGTVSFWVKFGADGTKQMFWRSNGGFGEIYRATDNKMYFELYNTGGSKQYSLVSTATVTVSDGWTHVMASWNGATTTGHIYIDGSVSEGTVTVNDQVIDYTRTNHGFFADDAGNDKVNADVADFLFDNSYIDLSNSANRDKFISGGKPVDLGADGSTPLGAQPLVFFKLANGAAVSTFASNKGDGGGMTLTGTLAEAGTSPSD